MPSAPPLVLLRCGGKQAGVVWEVVGPAYEASVAAGRAAAWEDGETLHRSLAGFVHLRTAAEAREFAARAPTVDVFITHGVPAVRKRLLAELRRELAGCVVVFPNAVHQHASVAPAAQLGEGKFIGALARVGNAARIGSFCLLGEGAVIGLGAVAKEGTLIAAWTTVGMHATVTKDITEPGLTWIGTPARPMRKAAVDGSEAKL
ncbi:hypothetical protein DFJ74DRAFT_713659 [Hyaloraphidium curvatum]|nr:hypothetical protein DFJ74DRAFT_713659 [Hyaloraphidium curvatum]